MYIYDIYVPQMGRYLHRLAVRAGTQVLSPIPESPSTTPPPDSDADTGSQAKDDTETNIVQSGVSESVKREESPKSQTINVEESFVEHLMSLNEEYREQLEATRKELRMERESKAQIVKDLEHYRVEYKNFKLSWTMDQAEITDLKARVQTLDTFQRQMKRMNDTITRLERENNTLKARYLDTDGQTPVFEETRAAMAPKMPSPPAEGHARRRPYTGKARDVKTPVLPPITDNNNVVMSSKQTASSDKKGANSPTHLPSLGNICPTPPSRPREDAPSRRQSRIPLVFPPIRGASSVGSIPFDHQPKQESGRTSRASQSSRRRHE
ncbi:peroxisomal membrane protein PER10-like [Haliotis rubra]|uniref:peroxisomal membrane protein PER10-like n=1 Tax=Haliotis rubra TaxID=36100 RepID=UPI001EE5AF19|nr:peroxisomal membrane protein PER10-like [Haliotis rubra]